MTINHSLCMQMAGWCSVYCQPSEEFWIQGVWGQQKSPKRNTRESREDPAGRWQTGRQPKTRRMEHSKPILSRRQPFYLHWGLEREKKQVHTRLQHQQVLGECSVPSGLPAASSSSTRFSSSAAKERSPSSSFLWAWRTSSVRRVKDYKRKHRQRDSCIFCRVHNCLCLGYNKPTICAKWCSCFRHFWHLKAWNKKG